MSGVCVRGGRLTSLVVELPQHLSDDLPDALQSLQVVLRLVVVLICRPRVLAHCGAAAGVLAKPTGCARTPVGTGQAVIERERRNPGNKTHSS